MNTLRTIKKVHLINHLSAWNVLMVIAHAQWVNDKKRPHHFN